MESATQARILADSARWLVESESRRRAFVVDLQHIVDALKPIDDAAHVETAGRATEVAKSLIAAIERS